MRALSRCLALTIAANFIAILGGCAQVDSPNYEKVLPSDYRNAFVQVRGCRASIDHDLAYVIVRTRPEMASVYDSGPYPFPSGTLVVKEQYRDSSCQDLSGYTAMRKEGSGYFPAGADWQWYTLDTLERVVQNGKVERCAGCHRQQCGDKRDRMCTEP